MRHWLQLACALGCLAASQAHGQSIPRNFTATATVLEGCGVTASTVNFGNLPPGAATQQVDALGSVVVTCTIGVAYTVGLDSGSNAQGANNRMRHATLTQYLGYDLYRNAARTQRWRDVPGLRLSGTGSGTAQSLPVYARLPAGQTPPAGAYVDLVTAIVRY